MLQWWLNNRVNEPYFTGGYFFVGPTGLLLFLVFGGLLFFFSFLRFLGTFQELQDCLTMSGIVQYVVVRGDLMKTLQWPVGAVVAQACHACTAVTHLFYNDEHTQAYLADLDNMHKVVLEAPDESGLRELHEKLDEDNIDHRLWIEQPENIPTCLVGKPYPKEQVQKYFKKFKLFKQ